MVTMENLQVHGVHVTEVIPRTNLSMFRMKPKLLSKAQEALSDLPPASLSNPISRPFLVLLMLLPS